MTVRLTDTAISKALRAAPETGRRDLSDAGCPGLRIRVTPAGAATWVLACRDRQGRMRRFTLGGYPAKGISLARDEARALHVKVKQEGADPTAARRRERVMGADAREGVGTLAAILDQYGEKRGNAQKVWAESRKRIDLIFKPLMKKPAAALTAGDFQLLADSYVSEASAGFVVRSIRPALKWAAQRGYLGEEVSRIRPPAPAKRRKRVLTRDELAALLPVLRVSSRPYAPALRFMLLTLTRRNETALARWRDVDMEARTWIIPETKNGEPHVVPLSRQAMDMLRAALPTDNAGNAKRPDPSALIFATSTGAPLGNWDRETKSIILTCGLGREDAKTGVVSMKDGSALWTRHDLRRTGATMLGDVGELPDIIEAALNHTSIHSALAATYNRSRYRPQVAAALQRLADALDGIEQGGAQIVQLHATASTAA
jgi:integrase